jgi:ribosome-associated translation inhibitor RaiA
MGIANSVSVKNTITDAIQSSVTQNLSDVKKCTNSATNIVNVNQSCIGCDFCSNVIDGIHSNNNTVMNSHCTQESNWNVSSTQEITENIKNAVESHLSGISGLANSVMSESELALSVQLATTVNIALTSIASTSAADIFTFNQIASCGGGGGGNGSRGQNSIYNVDIETFQTLVLDSVQKSTVDSTALNRLVESIDNRVKAVNSGVDPMQMLIALAVVGIVGIIGYTIVTGGGGGKSSYMIMILIVVVIACVILYLISNKKKKT